MTVSTIEPAGLDIGNGELARWAGILPAAASLAERISNTEFVPEAMRGNAAVVTAAIMYGDELGVGPMQALAGINVIKGKPSPSSELMRALVFRAGHTMRVLKSDGQVCRIVGQRHGERDGTVIEWTLAMARAAGLLDNPTWRRYPRAMLLARASSELCRVVFPDVVKGLGHIVDDEAVAFGFDDWAATETSTEPEADKATTVVQRRPPLAKPLPSSAQGQPVENVSLPDPDDYPPHPAPQGLDEPERLEGWPDGTEQPPLPLSEPESNLEPAAGGVPPTPQPPSASSVVAEPLPVPDDADAEREDQAPPGQRLLATIHALFGDLGVTKDERGLRLAITSAAIGRPIGSSNQLTRREGLALVRVLNDLNQDLLTFGVNADGSVDIYPPGEDEQR